jgi:hypothetical protein
LSSEANDILRIFVVGCPRSGTTLVQSLLAAHPHLTGFTESHFFDKAFKPMWPPRYRLRGDIQPWVRQFLAENELDPHWLDGLGRPQTQRTFATDVAANLISLLDRAARHRNAQGWVEKTPDHVFRIPLLQHVAPKARFVHVIRRAEGVLPSLRKASETAGWANRKSWTECAIHWLWALHLSNRYATRHEHYLLSYEQLVADPQRQMHALLQWLGLPWHNNLLDDYTAQAQRLVAAGETWKASTFGQIENKNVTPLDQLPLSARCLANCAWRLKHVRHLWEQADAHG